MAEIQPLVSLDDLKFTLLKEIAKGKRVKPIIEYDKDFDALIIMFTLYGTESVVYYLDQHIAIIFDEDTLEVVGIQIEDFERDFVPTHASVMHMWRDVEAPRQNFGELMIVVETKKKNIAREVVKASEELLPDSGAELMMEALK